MNFVYKKGNIGHNTLGHFTLSFLFYLLGVSGRDGKDQPGSSSRKNKSYEECRMQRKKKGGGRGRKENKRKNKCKKNICGCAIMAYWLYLVTLVCYAR